MFCVKSVFWFLFFWLMVLSFRVRLNFLISLWFCWKILLVRWFISMLFLLWCLYVMFVFCSRIWLVKVSWKIDLFGLLVLLFVLLRNFRVWKGVGVCFFDVSYFIVLELILFVWVFGCWWMGDFCLYWFYFLWRYWRFWRILGIGYFGWCWVCCYC